MRWLDHMNSMPRAAGFIQVRVQEGEEQPFPPSTLTARNPPGRRHSQHKPSTGNTKGHMTRYGRGRERGHTQLLQHALALRLRKGSLALNETEEVASRAVLEHEVEKLLCFLWEWGPEDRSASATPLRQHARGPGSPRHSRCTPVRPAVARR